MLDCIDAWVCQTKLDAGITDNGNKFAPPCPLRQLPGGYSEGISKLVNVINSGNFW